MLEDLSKYASLVLSCVFALVLLEEVGISSTTGSTTISNQLEAGSIIVRHMKSISVPSLLGACMGQLIDAYCFLRGNSDKLSREFSILLQASFIYLAGTTVFDL
jgi:hypothetical protein